MKNKQYSPTHQPVQMAQRGAGMIEVLVAILLLAIGVLGYAALQVRAVESTTEALSRSQAMIILRGLGENIRVNSAAQSSYVSAVHGYAAYTTATTAPASCVATSATDNTSCTAAALATFDAFQAASVAFRYGIHLDMYECPGVSGAPVKRQCLFAAWGKTNPVISGATPAATDCMSATGAYTAASTCLMLETY